MEKEVTINGEVYVMKAYLDRKKINHGDIEEMFEVWLSEEERDETADNLGIIEVKLDEAIKELEAKKKEKDKVTEKLLDVMAMVVAVEKQMVGLNDIKSVV